MSFPGRGVSLKKIALAVVCSTAMLFPYVEDVRANGLQTQMDRIFLGMTNATPPGVWESQRRGVINGGRITAKNRIMTESLVRITPPSWSAGCGGVDMHMGSFSYINSDQLVQMLRSIAANAQGYAFQLALDTVFPAGAKWIENFQKVMRGMNSSMLNSCEAGQGVVNNTINALGFSEHVEGMTEASATGLVDGFFDGFSERAGEPTGKVLDNMDARRRSEIRGNIVWKELRRNAAHTWFPGGDIALLEAILSISGSTIVGRYNDEGEQDLDMLPGNIITLEDLMLEGDITVYDCSSDPADCDIGPSDRKTLPDFVGFKELYRRMLLGHDGSGGVAASPGILAKMVANVGQLTNAEQDFMASLPSSLSSMIRNLTVASPDSAAFFVNRSLDSMAIFMAHQLASNMIHSSIQTVANSNNPWASRVVENLMQSRMRLNQEYSSLLTLYPSMTQVMDDYQNTLEAISLNRYTLQDMSKARAQ